METVFWLMWLADVSNNITGAGVIFAVVFACIWGFYALNSEFFETNPRRLILKTWWMLIPMIVGALVPSPETLRIFAATKAASVAVDTPLGQKGLDAANAILDQIIDKAKSKSK